MEICLMPWILKRWGAAVVRLGLVMTYEPGVLSLFIHYVIPRLDSTEFISVVY